MEIAENAEPRLSEPNMLGNFTPAEPPEGLPAVCSIPEASAWLHEKALRLLLEETRTERIAEVERISDYVELSLTELLQRADDEIGRALEEKDRGVTGAEGRLAQEERAPYGGKES